MNLADVAWLLCVEFGADPATLSLDAVEVEGDTAFVAASAMMPVRLDAVEVTVRVE